MEVFQILKALRGETKGWINHPATRMFRGYERTLIAYGVSVCDEWLRRGFKDTCRDKIMKYINWGEQWIEPPWLGDEKLHSSHRAALLKKNYQWYSQFGWKEEPKIEYYWPVGK